MHIVAPQSVALKPVTGHRTGESDNLSFRRLAQGTPGSPERFEFSIVQQIGGSRTPRHLHRVRSAA